MKRKLRNPPALAMESESKIEAFPLAKPEADGDEEDEDIGIANGDVVQELWVFGEA